MHSFVKFRDLPFTPIEGQVIYVEQKYNKRLNKFIVKNYDKLKRMFRWSKLDFCYLPLMAEKTIAYNAPYLNADECKVKAEQTPSLTDYIVGDELDRPYLLVSIGEQEANDKNETKLQAFSIDTKWYRSIMPVFEELALEIQSELKENGSKKKPEESDDDDDFGIMFSLRGFPTETSEKEVERKKPCNEEVERKKVEFDADKEFDKQSLKLIREIKERIKALRNMGVNTLFLHQLIDEGEKISRLRITRDFRIFLTDYNNIEIKMSVLPKALFLLFLHHSEGIRFKEMPDYRSELLSIYLAMNPNGTREKQEQSIRDVTDPCSNSINEKCARIREAFVAQFDDRLAKNYYITGKRGEPKRIQLDKSMIIWE